MLIVGDDNETKSFPIVNVSIIAACTLIAVWTLGSSVDTDSFLNIHGCVPARFFGRQNAAEYLTLLSSVFLHGGYLHLIGNMWYLYIFGDNIEDHFGHFNYACFYITCGIVAGLAQMGAEPTSWIPCVGASGAIAGVLGAYLVLYPHARVKTWWGDDSLIFAFRSYMIPAWVVIGAWFFLQYLCMNAKIPSIGWHAHIFGFLTGILIVAVYRMCGENCADNDSHAHQGYAYAVATNPQQQAINKAVTVVLLFSSFTGCAIYYMNKNANSKAATVAAQTAKIAPTAVKPNVSAQASKKIRTMPKSKHGKTIDRKRAAHKRAAAIT